MIDEIRNLLEQYRTWLRDKTTLRQLNDWIEITTPYVDRHNDLLQIYAKRLDGGYLLTDDGYILDGLEQSGCRLEGSHRLGLLKITLNGFGVQQVENELQVRVSAENFARRKHNLLQAMLAVNDLFYLAQATVSSFFYEDVAGWLDDCDIRYTPEVTLKGKSGYDHRFNFIVPKSRTRPERLLRTINRPDRNIAQAVVFSCIDTRDTRPADSLTYAILNDQDRSVSGGVRDALRNYDVYPVLWSARDEVREELAA